MEQEKILKAIKKNGRPIKFIELEKALIKYDKKEISESLDLLLASFEIMKTKDNRYALPSQLGVCIGKLQKSAKGFGFLLQPEDDIFIPQAEMNTAMNGDVCVVKNCTPKYKRRDGKKEGKVLEILSRGTSEVIGVLEKQGNFAFVSPTRMNEHIFIDHDSLNGAELDDLVVVHIDFYPQNNKPCIGHVEKILGNKDDAGIDIISAIAQFGIPTEFPQGVLDMASNAPTTVEKDQWDGRTDYTNVPTVTIDGDDAKDLDDAISLDFDGENYNLAVHIADVSHYVTMGSAIDKEANLRGNSVYFPGSVIPMLPTTLSNGICSLNPNVDRLCISCIMKIDANGNVLESNVCKTVINTNYRMTYDDVNKILLGDKEVCQKYSDFTKNFNLMNKLREILFNKRKGYGSIEFDLPEAKFILDDDGRIKDIVRHERGDAQMLIEEFMLMANQTVCKYMLHLDLPCMFRVHEVPTDEKMVDLSAFVGSFGYKLNPKNVTPKKIQNLLAEAAGNSEFKAITTIVLRSLQKARYSSENKGHFGLAFMDYCHFTSPIRRYSDLIVHRILSYSLSGDKKTIHDIEKNLESVAIHISETEKKAMDAENYVNDIYKCQFMEQFIGDTFDGIISGMNNSGFYVELQNTCEGMVRMANVQDDYYVYNEKLRHMIGERKRKIFKIGDAVKITVTAVNPSLRQIDMDLVN